MWKLLLLSSCPAYSVLGFIFSGILKYYLWASFIFLCHWISWRGVRELSTFWTFEQRRKASLKSLIHSSKERKVLSKNKIVTSPLRQCCFKRGNMSCFRSSRGPWEGQLHLSPMMEIFRFRGTISPSPLLSVSSPLAWIRTCVCNLTDSSFLLPSLWRWTQHP
jgi:hypothetical protein